MPAATPFFRYFLSSAVWPRPSRTSLPLKFVALSGRFDGSAFSPAFGIAPL
jgi:hypothetical protein